MGQPQHNEVTKAADESEKAWHEARDDNCWVMLTSERVETQQIVDFVRSPHAGAMVTFTGTTRDQTHGKSVQRLEYTSYPPMAIKSLLSIAQSMLVKHQLIKIAMCHRCGVIPIGEETVIVAVSSPHRGASWRAAEEALELIKKHVEVWKREVYQDGCGQWIPN